MRHPHKPDAIVTRFTKLESLVEQYREIVSSPKLKEFMRAKPAFCGGCRLEEQCLGGCKAAAEACYGSLNACDPFLELNRESAHKIV